MPQASLSCFLLFLAAARKHPGRAGWISLQGLILCLGSILIRLAILSQALIIGIWNLSAPMRLVALWVVFAWIGHDTAFGGWAVLFLAPLLGRRVGPWRSAGQWVWPKTVFDEVAFEAHLAFLTDGELDPLLCERTQALEQVADEWWPDTQQEVRRQREIGLRVQDQRRVHRRAYRWLRPETH